MLVGFFARAESGMIRRSRWFGVFVRGVWGKGFLAFIWIPYVKGQVSLVRYSRRVVLWCRYPCGNEKSCMDFPNKLCMASPGVETYPAQIP